MEKILSKTYMTSATDIQEGPREFTEANAIKGS